MIRYSCCVRWSAALLSLAMLALARGLRADEPFDYFRNSWNVIGLKDYNDGARVTPDNRLLLAGKATVRIRCGRELIPLSRKQTKTLLDGWLPVILITAGDGPVRYDFQLFATPLPSVKDFQKAFDWPTEGENFLNWIVVKATNTGRGKKGVGSRFFVERAAVFAKNDSRPLFFSMLPFLRILLLGFPLGSRG